MWANVNQRCHEHALGLEATLAASVLKHSSSQVGQNIPEMLFLAVFHIGVGYRQWIFYDGNIKVKIKKQLAEKQK